MAEEKKSRLTGLIGLITAVSGLIAAVVALSDVLKPMFGSAPATANTAISNVASAPGNVSAAPVPSGQFQPQAIGTAQRAAEPTRQGGGPGYTTTSENGASGTHEATVDSPTHAEPAPHHQEPVETPATDDTTHESE